MAATSSISGLASGLDTATIIDQLMQLEAVPQNQLKSRQTSEQNKQAAYRSLNTDISALMDKAKALADTSTWQTLQGTVTGGTGVSVKVSSAASASTFSVTVNSVATNHRLGFTSSAAMSDVVVSGSSVKLTSSDGTVHDIATGGGTMAELVSAINAAAKDTGVTATAVKTANGSYRLLAQSTTTGASSSFTLTNADGSALLGGATVSAGTDAEIDLGAGITASSSTNTFTGVMPGVDITLDASATVGSMSNVKVAQNSTTVASAVNALVTQLNSLLSSIDTKTANATGSGATATAGGVLAGDATARSVRNSLVEAIFGGTGSMAAVGLQTDKYGMLTFDQSKFNDAYAKDPAATAAMFTAGDTSATDGWAARLQTVANAASNSRTGSISTAIAGEDTTIKTLTASIADWDDRLALRRSTLQAQYTALETALNSMQSQSSWLAGQISSLPSWNS